MSHTVKHPGRDPWGLIPAALPPHPRVLVTPAHIAFTRSHLATCAWRKAAFHLLLQRCAEIPKFHDDPRQPLSAKIKQAYTELLFSTVRTALAFHLTRDSIHRQNALNGLRKLAEAYLKRPVTGHDCRVAGGGMYESAYIAWLAGAYDLLAAEGFTDRDQRRFEELLEACDELLHANPHRTCSNHNSWGIRAGLSIAAARHDLQGLHFNLYGGPEKDRKRYGFIHQLRHDLLADGIEWEHNLRHHFLTLAVYADIADRCRNIGIDLWHRPFPSAVENEGDDLHAEYGPPGEKWLRGAFDGPLYQLFPSDEFPLFGDSRLSRLRGLAEWGIFYSLVYEAHEDPRHAWLLDRLEEAYRPRPFPDLPATLQTDTNDIDFVRLLRNEWPRGESPFARDSSFSLSGRYRQGCSLFPTNGSALLRADPHNRSAPAAFLFWGPHSGGHQGPAALNLELYAGGRRLTDTPWSRSFDDPLHLTWCRSTVAHNTVTVDETPMYPYDQPTESIWESDYWHKKNSAGTLVSFHSEPGAHRVRASNEKVYPGVRLDRTIVVGPDYILDLYRCLSDCEHLYDWSIHFPAPMILPKNITPINLGQRPGYRHLRNACRQNPSTTDRCAQVDWTFPCGFLKASCQATTPADFLFARTPEPTDENGFPGSDHRPEMACSTLLIRTRARSTAFVVLFSFGNTTASHPTLEAMDGLADTDIHLTLARSGQPREHRKFPLREIAERTGCASPPLCDKVF